MLADGAYDRAKCRQDLLKRGIEGCIPKRRKGRLRSGQEWNWEKLWSKGY